MSVRVLAPGLYTTVQDLGRPGYRAFGLPVGGAADSLALRLANLMAGNPEEAAAFEYTLLGPTLEFQKEAVVAWAGASFDMTVNGEALEPGRAYLLPAGSVLAAGRAAAGCRAYLAVAGGLDVPGVLRSRSTYARAGIGGLHGRPLAADDVLPAGPPAPAAARLRERLRHQLLCEPLREPHRQKLLLHDVTSSSTAVPRGEGSHHTTGGCLARSPRFASPELFPYIPDPAQPVTVRVLPGKEAPLFEPEAVERFYGDPYVVRPEADRMGARLAGPPLSWAAPAASMISEAVAPGAVQVPPDGQPILLMADCPTTGGYPRIAHTASIDLPLLGQLRPGMKVRFRGIGILEAEKLLLEREWALARLKLAISSAPITSKGVLQP